jgi:murein DD-endopeptidase MepM/ murein hydrolase activator NlpD
MHIQRIVIEPPVTGNWVIYNPPGHPALGFDFLAEDEDKSLYKKGGFLRHLVSFIPVDDTFTWSSPVFSPVDGIVVESHDAEDDRIKISFIYDLISLLRNKPSVSDGFGAFGGNHIMISAGGYFVLLCHLRKNSVKVKEGETVQVGQQIAEVGNSGASIQPHLHIQVMSTDKIFPLFENLLPFTFTRGKVKQGSNWSSHGKIEPKNRTHYSFERTVGTFGDKQERS